MAQAHGEIDPLWWASGQFEGRPMGDILCSRDIGALFRFLASRGWSRSRIAAATGLTENRVRGVAKCLQNITSYEVLVRVADGLSIDRGRMGLAFTDHEGHPGTDVSAQRRTTGMAPPTDLIATLFDHADTLRQEVDRTLAASPGVTATQVSEFEEVAGSSARLCVVAPPIEMLDGLLRDIAEVRALIPLTSRPPLQLGLYAVVARLAALAADEFMVLGEARQSRSWFATARFAADQTGDAILRSHVRALAALLPLYYGPSSDAVTLTDQAIAIAEGRGGVHLALAHTYRALAFAHMLADKQSVASLGLAGRHFDELSDTDREDSVFGFSEGRWRFYQGRILSHLGRVDEGWAIHDEALASYPPSAVGDTSMIHFDRAISIIRRAKGKGELQRAIDLATRTYDDLPADHRTELFVRAAHRVIATVRPADRDAPPVRAFRGLLRADYRRGEPPLPT